MLTVCTHRELKQRRFNVNNDRDRFSQALDQIRWRNETQATAERPQKPGLLVHKD